MRVGLDPDPSHDHYQATGAWMREAILDILPEGWTFSDKRVLDFGCGAGRVLRQFTDVAAEAEVWGCDIHAESVTWLERNLRPPFHFFRNAAVPPLPIADGYFDLVWAMSVFTHIGDGWEDWLLEMRRVLAPGGLFVASYLGANVLEELLGVRHDDDEIGMLVHDHSRAPAEGGPWVFHSDWWLRRHWGPAFEIVEARPAGDSARGGSGLAHGLVLARRRAERPDRNAMSAIDGADPREIAALQAEVRMLRGELERARAGARLDGKALAARARRAVLRTPLGEPARRLGRRIRRARAR